MPLACLNACHAFADAAWAARAGCLGQGSIGQRAGLRLGHLLIGDDFLIKRWGGGSLAHARWASRVQHARLCAQAHSKTQFNVDTSVLHALRGGAMQGAVQLRVVFAQSHSHPMCVFGVYDLVSY